MWMFDAASKRNYMMILANLDTWGSFRHVRVVVMLPRAALPRLWSLINEEMPVTEPQLSCGTSAQYTAIRIHLHALVDTHTHTNTVPRIKQH